MKKIIFLLVFIVLFGLSIYYHEEISDFIISNISNYLKNSSKLYNNRYALDGNYKYISLTKDFYPKNKKDIENIYYTIINSGMEDFTFYCDTSYKECLDDVYNISTNQKLLSHFNDFVHIFNSFKNIETEFDTLGKVKVHITHNYSTEQIDTLNNRLVEIINSIINKDDKIEDKIKTFHDYVISNSKYDSKKSDNNDNSYHSDIAYGALIEGYAICGGYADSMKLFLDYYKIPNFKVSSDKHIWNAVYINDKWLHLDLTWDDPVTSTGENILDYNYYLITTKQLLDKEKDEHNFSFEIYQELVED